MFVLGKDIYGETFKSVVGGTHPAADCMNIYETCMIFYPTFTLLLCAIFHKEVRGQWAGFSRMEVCQLR